MMKNPWNLIQLHLKSFLVSTTLSSCIYVQYNYSIKFPQT